MTKLLLFTLSLFLLSGTVMNSPPSVQYYQWIPVPLYDSTFLTVWSEVMRGPRRVTDVVTVLKVRFDPNSRYPYTNYWLKAMIREEATGDIKLGEVTIFRKTIGGDFEQYVNTYCKPEDLDPSFF